MKDLSARRASGFYYRSLNYYAYDDPIVELCSMAYLKPQKYLKTMSANYSGVYIAKNYLYHVKGPSRHQLGTRRAALGGPLYMFKCPFVACLLLVCWCSSKRPTRRKDLFSVF